MESESFVAYHSSTTFGHNVPQFDHKRDKSDIFFHIIYYSVYFGLDLSRLGAKLTHSGPKFGHAVLSESPTPAKMNQLSSCLLVRERERRGGVVCQGCQILPK